MSPHQQKKKKIRRDNDDIKDLFKGDVLDMIPFVASIDRSLNFIDGQQENSPDSTMHPVAPGTLFPS